MSRVDCWVERLRDCYLWSCVAPSLQSLVFTHFLEGVIAAIETKKATWKLNTKMPEFTMQVWAMTKVIMMANIPYSQSSAKLPVDPVTRSLSHLVTWSLGHLVIWSLDH